MAYPYYSAHRPFYGHTVLERSRQYHCTDKDPICPGIHDSLFTNCRLDSVFWQSDGKIDVKRCWEAIKLESYEVRRPGGLE